MSDTHDGVPPRRLINSVNAINWNNVTDPKDLEVWNRLTSNFWLPEKVPLSNDLPSWGTLNEDEKNTVIRVFSGLTLLDTVQSEVGAVEMMADSLTQHEEACLGNIVFMEAMSGDTELLTPHGWKRMDGITPSDKVMQYDPLTGTMTFVHPARTTVFDADEAYEIVSHNGNARQVVSGGHRVMLEVRNNHSGEWHTHVTEARLLANTDEWRMGESRFRLHGVIPKNVIDMVPATESDTISSREIIIKDAPAQRMYCVQVPTTFLLTRNGESTVITGNCVHAKSYSSIFSTLCSSKEIDEAFRWTENNEHLQRKAEILVGCYRGNDPLKKKIVSVLMESFLFYSGFYLPFYWASRGKLSNAADILRLILRDECMSGDTELLTPNGWKSVSDVTTADEVMQWNEDGTMEFVNPVHTSFHDADKTYYLANKQGHVQQHVSTNHRVLVERGADNKVLEFRAGKLRKQDLDVRTRFINTGVVVAGGDTELTPVERLLIAIQADGAFDTTTRNQAGDLRRNGSVIGTVPCKFAFSKERKSERLKMLSAEAGWELVDYGVDARGRNNFVLKVPVEFPRDKKLASIRGYASMSAAWCEDAISEIAVWDGHIVKENTDRVTYGCVDKDNSLWVQTVASLAGFRTHWGVRPDHRKETFKDIYRVQIHRGLSRTGAQKVFFEERSGERMYGVEVPSSYLLTRLNGSVVVTGNSVHGYYIGYKFQKNMELPENKHRADELKAFAYATLWEFYENECHYAEDLYDHMGCTEDVKAYMRLNANRALANLGYEPMFPADECEVNPAILAAMDAGGNETHDFFSGSGSSYVMGKAESTEDEDWDY